MRLRATVLLSVLGVLATAVLGTPPAAAAPSEQAPAGRTAHFNDASRTAVARWSDCPPDLEAAEDFPVTCTITDVFVEGLRRWNNIAFPGGYWSRWYDRFTGEYDRVEGEDGPVIVLRPLHFTTLHAADHEIHEVTSPASLATLAFTAQAEGRFCEYDYDAEPDPDWGAPLVCEPVDAATLSGSWTAVGPRQNVAFPSRPQGPPPLYDVSLVRHRARPAAATLTVEGADIDLPLTDAWIVDGQMQWNLVLCTGGRSFAHCTGDEGP